MSKKEDNNKSNNIPKDANKELSREERQELFEKAKNGEIEHKQYKSLSKNLIPLNQRSEEERKAIQRKGWEAMMNLKGERKNAKQILDSLLPLYANNNAINENDSIPIDIKKEILSKNIKITQYDLIMLSMIYKAQNGDVKSAEFVANHYGDIVTKEVNIKDSMSESDRKLIEKLSKRMGLDEVIDT